MTEYLYQILYIAAAMISWGGYYCLHFPIFASLHFCFCCILHGCTTIFLIRKNKCYQYHFCNRNRNANHRHTINLSIDLESTRAIAYIELPRPHLRFRDQSLQCMTYVSQSWQGMLNFSRFDVLFLVIVFDEIWWIAVTFENLGQVINLMRMASKCMADGLQSVYPCSNDT